MLWWIMSYTKIYLPDIEILKNRLNSLNWINYYRKFEVVIGPINSVEYLKQKIKYDSKKNWHRQISNKQRFG